MEFAFGEKRIPFDVIRQCREYRRKKLSPVVSTNFSGTQFFSRKSLKHVRLSESVLCNPKDTKRLVGDLNALEQ